MAGFSVYNKRPHINAISGLLLFLFSIELESLPANKHPCFILEKLNMAVVSMPAF